MHFNFRIWPLGLALLCSTSLAECGPAPEQFETWPEDEAVPVETIPQGQWFRSPHGWVVAPGWCQAVEAAWEQEAAFEAFEQHFGRTPVPGALVDVKHAGVIAALRAAGAAWILPWRFAAEPGSGAAVDSRTNAIREQIESQLSGAGKTPDPEQVEMLVQQAFSQLAPSAETAAERLEPKALRHEIAHMLFIHGVWPSSQAAQTQYGGDAPDWLDEAAAVAAESEAMTAARRRLFHEAAREGQLIPLERYLSMTHPVFGSNDMSELMREARETAARDGAAVVSASVDDEQIAGARLFYAQTRGWLDFLHKQTGNSQILGDITDALRSGQSFEEWLTHVGPDAGLPDSLAALEAAFQSRRVTDSFL